MSSEVNVWYWDVRFFKPLQKEEFHVHVDPGGRIVGYEHLVEEAAPGARLDRDAALARATDFLRNTLHLPLDTYTFLPEEASSEARPDAHRLELYLGAHRISRARRALPAARGTRRRAHRRLSGIFEGARGVEPRFRAAALVEQLSSR